MTTRAAASYDAPINSEWRATATFVLLLLAGLVWFMWPHYFGVSWANHGPLGIGDQPSQSSWVIEPWQTGDYASLRHLRYDNGSTCTEIVTGPSFDFMVCR